MGQKEDAQKSTARDLRDRIRTNRQKDGSLSSKDVDALLGDFDRQLGEDPDAAPPAETDPLANDKPLVATGDEAGPGSARPGKGSTDYTPGRDALPGTPLNEGENPNLPTGGPVADNVPGPGQDPSEHQ